ncbi:MAG: transcription-repair coupling factor [Eubacteriales bacterium]|nr:transcription-repair coupling factor [Eubacteriales bacterium]MDD3882020.1 transcription-repair coupling factor [Eubacteriales bacterium]MDD4512467.1 transcription-repair coupling factor [Eubacteriales bacterium]
MNGSIFSPIQNAGWFGDIKQTIALNKCACIYDLSQGQRPYLFCALANSLHKRQMLVIMQTEQAAQTACEDACQLLGAIAAYLPPNEINFFRAAAQSREIVDRRTETLCKLISGEIRMLFLSPAALCQPMLSKESFIGGTIALKDGDVFDPQALVQHLTRYGYQRVETISAKGECAIRGSILDVYPPSEQNAVRIEFFDDEVDSIRSFDALSQRSIERVKQCVIPPAQEYAFDKEQARYFSDKLLVYLGVDRELETETTELFPDLPPLPDDDDDVDAEDENAKKIDKGGFSDEATLLSSLRRRAEALASGISFDGFMTWLRTLSSENVTILDWMNAPIVCIDQPEAFSERVSNGELMYEEAFKNALERSEALPQQAKCLYSADELLSAIAPFPRVLTTDFLRSLSSIRPDSLYSWKGQSLSGYHSQINALIADMQSHLSQGRKVLILSGGHARAKRLLDSIDEAKLAVKSIESAEDEIGDSITLLPLAFHHGFILEDERFVLMSDEDIFSGSYRKSRQRRNAGERISAFTELKVGDYVVHELHGVGIYQGTTRIQSEGTYRDYLLIQYSGSDKLYVPTDQLDRVQKYIGGDSSAPKINKLGGTEWQRQKGKVKAGLKAMAFDLVKLYAARQDGNGFRFSPDSPWQRQFEEQFPYEPTDDQENAIADIKADMEKPQSMDRLLCGDVGYGKTEVALRAAFKAVMDSKQVCLLAPTTILAQQHYRTILKRFEGFPVQCEMLSRFRSPQEQKEIIAKVKEGKIDILVGTHRLLNKAIQYKDLGLLIIDEEQRFGVAHKEIIKNMKKNVDVLTLSATPIPRTLHMSMVGIRDMSLLEAPPEERYPVQTYVMEYSDAVIRDAILREIGRGGQIYFLYNRVQSIEKFYDRLRALVPEARIGIAHGQLREHALEDIMMDFYDGKYDVLLCTTIIESGLDIPTANTLIVFDSDRFGLSQLYQLRGRVGRSNRLAYAYFTVRPDKMLSETAQKRLTAIREFTDFGSGFRIAMRDLEIRGAGNILGPEQSGHMSTVGYDLYCKLMEEAVREMRGELGQKHDLETRVELHADAYLPASYIPDEKARMDLYKRISLITFSGEREEMEDELVDRFGDIPPQVYNLLSIAQIRSLSNRLGVSLVTFRVGILVMRFDTACAPEGIYMLKAIQESGAKLTLLAQEPPSICYHAKSGEDILYILSMLPELLEKLVTSIEKSEAESENKKQT